MLSKIVAGDISFFYCYFSEKIRLDISCESSAVQTIHMKCQALFIFSEKYKTNDQNVVWCSCYSLFMG